MLKNRWSQLKCPNKAIFWRASYPPRFLLQVNSAPSQSHRVWLLPHAPVQTRTKPSTLLSHALNGGHLVPFHCDKSAIMEGYGSHPSRLVGWECEPRRIFGNHDNFFPTQVAFLCIFFEFLCIFSTWFPKRFAKGPTNQYSRWVTKVLVQRDLPAQTV